MSSFSALANSFMKEQSNPNVEFTDAKVKSNQFTSCGEKATLTEPQKSSLRSINDMSQTICLFKKYLLTRAQSNINKTNTEESEIIKKCPSNTLSVHATKCEPRFQTQASSLEQKLLPQMRCDGVPSSLSEDRSSTPQLTIFYGGAINVYNNIPLDKAQAIMVLASESSLSNTTGTEIPKNDKEAPSYPSNVTLINKPKTGLPMARRYSLQCFLKNRRNRIVNKSPYASPSNSSSSRNMADMTLNEVPYPNHTVSLSPFPSRLGFCSSIS